MDARTRANIYILILLLLFFATVIFAPYSPFRLPGLKLLATTGISTYQELLGEMYLYGAGVNENRSSYRLYGAHIDYPKAYYWLQRASKGGNLRAASLMGNMYSHGWFVPLSYEEANKWYSKAAEQGNDSGEYNLGVSYENGSGEKQDYVQARKWYLKSAEQGYSYAERALASLYEAGLGVRQDYAEAAKWYEKAAKQGNSLAECELGILYEDGNGVPQNFDQAAKWYQLAGKQGESICQYNLGVLYQKGLGVPKDFSKSRHLFELAASHGVNEAIHNIGMMYFTGQGEKQDYAEAAKWFHKAADANVSDAQYALAFMYAKGKGVSIDYQQCTKWAQPAADQGDSDAKELYGTCKRCALQHNLSANSVAHNITASELETRALISGLEKYVDIHEDSNSLLVSNFHLDLARFYIHSGNEQKAKEHLKKITVSDYADQLLEPYVGMVLEAFSNHNNDKIFSVVNDYKHIYQAIHKVQILGAIHVNHVPDEKYVAQNLCGFAGITYAREHNFSQLDKLSHLPQCRDQVLRYKLAELLANREFKAAYTLMIANLDVRKTTASNPDAWAWDALGKTFNVCVRGDATDHGSEEDRTFFLKEANKLINHGDEVTKLVLANFLHILREDEALNNVGQSLSDPKRRETVLTWVYEDYYLKGDRINTFLLANALDIADAPHPAETRMREGGWPQMQWYSYPIHYADVLVKHPSALGYELAMTIKSGRARFRALDGIYWASKDDPNITFPNCNEFVARCIENELLQIAGKEQDAYSRDIMYEDIVNIENQEKDFAAAEKTFNKVIDHRRMRCGGSICNDNHNNPTTYVPPVSDAACSSASVGDIGKLSARAFISVVQCSYESGVYREYLKDPAILGETGDRFFVALATVLQQHEIYSDELLSVIAKIKNKNLRLSVFNQVVFAFYSPASAGDKKVAARMNNFVDALMDSADFQRDDNAWADMIEMLERRYWSNFESRNEMGPKDESEWSELIWGNIEKLLSKRPDLEECDCGNVFNLVEDQCPIERLVIRKKYEAALETPTELDRALARDAILRERFLHENENYRNSINRGWQYSYAPTLDFKCPIGIDSNEQKH